IRHNATTRSPCRRAADSDAGAAIRRSRVVPVNETMTSKFAVILATRNRPKDAARAVRSILANRLQFTLIIVDQSDNSETADALSPFISDSRMRVLKSMEVGLARARNLGWRSTNAELLAFTDDDCEPCPGWLETLASALAY